MAKGLEFFQVAIVVKILPASAGDAGSDLMQADSTCWGQLSPSAETTEARVPTARAQQREEPLQ